MKTKININRVGISFCTLLILFVATADHLLADSAERNVYSGLLKLTHSETIDRASIVFGYDVGCSRRWRDRQRRCGCVWLSTPDGFCAAIAAARERAPVILLEPTVPPAGYASRGITLSNEFSHLILQFSIISVNAIER